MSYKLKVLADNPIGYWTFNGNNNDVTSASNSASFSNISYVTPPIVANSGSSIKITQTSSISILNTAGGYEAFAKNTETNAFTISFWFDFNNQLPGSGYGQTVYANNQLKILTINSGTTEVGKIYYDYAKNTFRFSVGGSANSEAYYVLRDLDPQFYIVASYNNKKLNIRVNNEEGINGYVSDYSTIDTISKTSLSYKINGADLSGTANSFIVSELAFYDRELKKKEIRNHLVWGLRDGDPELNSSISSSADMIDFYQSQSQFGYGESLSGKMFLADATAYNLDVTDSGLSIKNIDDVVFNKINSSASYSISSASGISVSGLAGIDFNITDANRMSLSNLTINMQISRPTITNEYLFAIYNLFDNGSYLYLQSTSSAYSLYFYDAQNQVANNILNTSASPSVGSANFAINFSSSSIYMYTSDAGTASTSDYGAFLSPNSLNNNFNKITFGNLYESASQLVSSIKNIGITKNVSPDFSSFDFASPQTFMARLNNSSYPFFVSQYGNLIKIVPFAVAPIMRGTQVDWNSMSNCRVSISTDGQTYNVVQKNQSINFGTSTFIPGNVFLKVEMFSDSPLEVKNQTFNNLSVLSYINQNFSVANASGGYSVSSPSAAYNSYPAIKNNNFRIFSNLHNFGLRFSGNSSMYSGYASVSPAGVLYNALEVWYRPDTLKGAEADLVVTNTTSSTTEPSIYVQNNKVYFVGSALYVNGVSQTSGSFSASANTTYHLTLIMNNSSSADFCLNGYSSNIDYNYSSATYGYLNIWNNAPNPTRILDRYTSFFGVKTTTINDTNSVKIIPNSTSDTVSIFKIG